MYVSILEGEDRVKGVGERRKGSKKGGRRKETMGGREKKRDTRMDKWDGRRLLPCLPHIAVNNINQYPTTAQGLSLFFTGHTCNTYNVAPVIQQGRGGGQGVRDHFKRRLLVFHAIYFFTEQG
jgi:hypothetical protein